jgi:hypothetical protein
VVAVVISVLIFFVLAAALGGVAYFTYHKKLRRAKAIERGLKMVPILIHLPPPSSDTQGGTRDVREVMREKTAQAEVLYNLIAGTATEGFKSNFYGQRHIALELIVTDGLVHFFAAVPVALVGVVKKAVMTAYPGARLEEVEDHNIFNQEGRLAATLGGEMVLRAESAYPIATYEQLERDPMEAILTAVSALDKQDGVAIQIMLRPAGQAWVKKSIALAENMRQGKHTELKFTAIDLARAALKSPTARREEEHAKNPAGAGVSQLQLSQVERIEEKTKHPGFEVLVRVIVSTGSVMRSQQLLREISTAFALYESPGLNGFKFLPAVDVQGLVTAFIFRFFPNELSSNVLSSAELATLFHLPDSQFTPSTSVARQQSKQVDGPVQLPATGLMFGYNEFRDARKEIRLSPEDRRRHTYVLGQTGTGKSTMLENLAVQDMLAGNGFAFIDPHGDSAEKLLALVPKERAEDVIYFNPADAQYPLGLNLFEFTDPAQKDFLVQETINMLYKLYDPGHTGIIGPRYEHWYRNAALTLMADPNGATFIEIPKVFTDTEYLKRKFKYLKDPTVIDFWTKEMGQTSDYHKSEMLGWFVSKFGAFQNNEMMRNIIGQTKSSFNIREVMDKKKILIVNLSKGRIGELNSQLLGMIFVIKFQAAAMSRADVPENERTDFALYVDEFQNFSTDSFASILSEARKYRLNLIVANQFIGQLSNEIRDAVFGNIGTIVAHRMGPDDAEFMTKQFAPVFDASDLVNIPNYHAAMRLMIGGLPSQPFSITDSAPLGTPNAELGLAIKQLSAAKYGHDKALVEADLVQRLTGQTAASAVPVAPASVAPAPVTTPADVAQPPAPPVLAPAPADAAAQALASVALTAAQPVLAAAPEVPLPVQPAPAADMVMAHTPPPIGAPPIDPTVQEAPVAQAPIVAEVQPEPAAATAPDAPVVEPAAAHTPPPIGAPPIDLPAASPAPAELSAPGTLSLDDITGGTMPVAAPEPTESVEDKAQDVADDAAEKTAALENDPYARIDVLGPTLGPVVQSQPPVVENVPEPEVEVTPEAAAEPQDVLVSAAEMPVESEPAPAPTAPPSSDWGSAPEPRMAEPVQPEQAESFIKFVDPAAQSVLDRPDLPTPVAPAIDAPSTDGLPEGVTMIAPAPVEPAVVPLAPVDIAPVPTTPLAAEPAESQGAAIAQAEHEIDDLLSVSLLHPDNHAARLGEPEPEAAEVPLAQAEAPAAIPDATPAEPEVSQAAATGPSPLISHHTSVQPAAVDEDDEPKTAASLPGMRVIEPLEPILPAKESFAANLERLVALDKASEAVAPAPAPVVPAPIVDTPADVPAPTAMPEELDGGIPEATTLGSLPAAGAIMNHNQPVSAPTVADLAAGVAWQPEPLQAEAAAIEPVQPVEPMQPPEPVAVAVEPAPEPVIVPEGVAAAPTPEVPAHLSGSMIMPTAQEEGAAAAPAEPVATVEKKKLAPGEIFVDASGNVVIGE